MPVSSVSSVSSGWVDAMVAANAGHLSTPMRFSQISSERYWRESVHQWPSRTEGSPTVRPPGTSMLPVMAMMDRMAWPACTPFLFWSMARPHRMHMGCALAMTRAAVRIWSAGTHVCFSTSSRGYSFTRSASSSKP